MKEILVGIKHRMYTYYSVDTEDFELADGSSLTTGSVGKHSDYQSAEQSIDVSLLCVKKL